MRDKYVLAMLGDKPFTTRPVWQWDKGLVLTFPATSAAKLPESYEMHWSNDPRGTASVQIGNRDGVLIPDEYINSGRMVYGWVYVPNEDGSALTVYDILIPVAQRAQPTDYEPTPVEQTAIDQAIAALNAAVQKCESAIDKTPHPENGVWVVWNAVTGEWESTGISAQGPQGKGIKSVQKTGTSGNTDTYTITYDDDSTSTYTLVNEANGEAYAVGTRSGTAVSQDDPAYQNNSKYFAEISKKFTDGKGFDDVVDPAYNENNAKYYAELTQAAEETATQAIQAKGEEVLQSIPADYTELSGEVSDLKNDKVDSSMMQKCEVVEVEASANLWNEDDVLTGIYHRNGTIYTGGNYDNFRYNKNRISVEEGDVLSFYYVSERVYPRSIQYITCFTSDGTIDGNAGVANQEVQSYTIPANVASVVLSVRYNWTDFMVIKNAEQAPTEYIPYSEEQHYYVATNDFIPENLRNQLVGGKQDAPQTVGTVGQVLGLDNDLNPVWIDQQSTITVDDEMSTNSTNPVQNKVISGAIGSKVDISLMKKCELVEIEETANKWNKDAAIVGMVHTNGQVYTGGSYDNYVYGVPIAVQPGDAIYFYNQQNATFVSANVARVVCFDANGTVVSSSSATDVRASFTVPNDIASIIVTEMKAYNASFMIIINDSTVPSTYIPYQEADSYYIATDEFIPQEIVRQAIDDKVDKDGTEQVTAKNCEFVDISKNLFNPETVETGLLNKSTGVVLPNYTNYVTSDWIEVEGSAYYTFSSSVDSYIYWVWYNSTKEWISGGEKNISLEPTKQAPANAKHIRFSILADRVYSNIQLEKGSTATSYRGFGTGYIKPEYMPPEETGIVFNIPKKVYALVGYETNIYFENLVEDWTKYKWDVTCTKGMQMERGYRITPESTDAGTYTLTFALTVGNHVEQFSTTLVVVSVSAGSGANESVIILGDSTTNNGIAVTKLNANLASDVYGLSTIGTRGTAPNKHEGRSGWKFEKYFQPASESDTAAGVENPWYNPTSETFDASYYFANSGVAKPDWFFINLGINDVFGNTSDSSLANTIAQCEEYLDAMIESMNNASPNTKIGICLTIPPNHSQDAFGKEYKCGQNRNRYKRNNLLWVSAIISDYDDREDEGIYLIPIHAALDTVYNMGLETLPVNARNTSITYESPIANGGVHPVESGYWQIADVYTAFLKAHANS